MVKCVGRLTSLLPERVVCDESATIIGLPSFSEWVFSSRVRGTVVA
jgi:hypothetical protein